MVHFSNEIYITLVIHLMAKIGLSILRKPGIKLSDEEIRNFICDGILVIDSGVAPEVNHQIFDKIQWNNNHEFNMGNNVLPRIPELQQVLDSPRIHGALESVLGTDYILHPHRFMHASEPVDEETRLTNLVGSEHAPTMGQGSSGFSGWHQDSQSPLSRARYHVPRYAMILYFPQDTPVERGPTRVIPGTQLQAGLLGSDSQYAYVCDHVKAGTCFLIAFDIAHAAFPNKTEISRYMFKFVFIRAHNPSGPSWDGGLVPWVEPQSRLGRYCHRRAWNYIWDWMRGERCGGLPATESSIEVLVGNLNGNNPELALNAVYELASLGREAVDPLVESLLSYAGQELKPYREDIKEISETFHPREWNEGAYALQDEAYALGAMGEPALDALIKLLQHDDKWIKINAAFALGEIGESAIPAIPILIKQLKDDHHQVVRVTLDALACIGGDVRGALPIIRKLLTTSNPAWQEIPIGRGWTGENQLRMNAMLLLLTSDISASEIEDLLVSTLQDPNGYVPALAIEALSQDGSPEGVRAALDFLKTHRWDDTLANERRVF